MAPPPAAFAVFPPPAAARAAGLRSRALCRWASPPRPTLPTRRQACGTTYLAREERRIAAAAATHWAPRVTMSAPGGVPSAAAAAAAASAAAAAAATGAAPSPAATTQTATLLDGKATAATVRGEVGVRVAALKAQYEDNVCAGTPGLAVVIVGERKDSQTYVRSKRAACEAAGIASFGYELPADASQASLIELIHTLNDRPDVHGILVQLPLPAGMNDEVVLDAIALDKDVDGFHALNFGRLAMAGRTPPRAVPCTPKGVMELLDRYGVDPAGKRAVVLGRSNIVGLPVALLLMHRNATVTVCHSKTTDVGALVRDADIVVSAVGRPGYVKAEWLKPGVVVVDVGINAVDDASKKRGYRLVGDVEWEGALSVASAITPVPGGVGPMTIAMLLVNTVDAAERSFQQ